MSAAEEVRSPSEPISLPTTTSQDRTSPAAGLVIVFFLSAAVVVFVCESRLATTAFPNLLTVLTIATFAILSLMIDVNAGRVSTAVYGLFFVGGIAAVRAALLRIDTTNLETILPVFKNVAAHFLADLAFGLLSALVIREFDSAPGSNSTKDIVAGIATHNYDVRQIISENVAQGLAEGVEECAKSMRSLAESTDGPANQVARLSQELENAVNQAKEWGHSVHELSQVLDEFVNHVVPLMEDMTKRDVDSHGHRQRGVPEPNGCGRCQKEMVDTP